MRVDPAAALWCIIIADGLNHGKNRDEIVRISSAAATSRLVMGGSNHRKSRGEIMRVYSTAALFVGHHGWLQP